jgi:hypothetical protein
MPAVFCDLCQIHIPLLQPLLMMAGTEAHPTEGFVSWETEKGINRGEMVKTG